MVLAMELFNSSPLGLIHYLMQEVQVVVVMGKTVLVVKVLMEHLRMTVQAVEVLKERLEKAGLEVEELFVL